MPISCEPGDLATAAKCFFPLSWRVSKAIRVYLLCAFINGDTVDCDPEALAEASTCYLASLSDKQLDAIETYLLCQVASGGGGGGGTTQVFSGNYGGGTPTDTPTTSAAIAYDLDSPFNEWHWDGAAWT